AHLPTHHLPASDNTEEPVIYDIYGEDEDDDNYPTTSPLEDDRFHLLNPQLSPASDAASPSAQPQPQSGEINHPPHNHQLKQVTSGADPSSPQPLQPHKKHVQLCPTCQRPREHHRPTCPACGTHFEEGLV